MTSRSGWRRRSSTRRSRSRCSTRRSSASGRSRKRNLRRLRRPPAIDYDRHVIRRVAYRFVAIYLGLFSVASQFLGGLFLFPGFQFPALGTVWPMRAITEWVGTHVFHVTDFAVYGTSADTAFHWVQLSWLVVVAAIVAVATTFVTYERTDQWFRLFLRFVLAT